MGRWVVVVLGYRSKGGGVLLQSRKWRVHQEGAFGDRLDTQEPNSGAN